jgi:hypothetical protein
MTVMSEAPKVGSPVYDQMVAEVLYWWQDPVGGNYTETQLAATAAATVRGILGILERRAGGDR